jgi:hypothetical protein
MVKLTDSISSQLFALIKEQTEQVHAKEPNALIYYAFKVQDKDEIIFVEKYAYLFPDQVSIRLDFFFRIMQSVFLFFGPV